MSHVTKLDGGQIRVLKLIKHEADEYGWALVSAPVFQLIKGTMPPELVTLRPVGDDGRGRVRLTDLGKSLFDAMEWL